MLRKITIALASVGLLAGLTACGSSDSGVSAKADDPAAALKVAVNPVPHGEILKYVKDELAAKAGLKLEIVEFSDYVQPNTALQEGQVQANYFQHVPFMEEFEKDKGVKLTFVAPVHIEPLGVYSKKVTDLRSVRGGGTVAVPNDPANLGRSLKLLADNGLLTLKPGAPQSATERDIATNPKGLKFKPLKPAQLPRSVADVDLAVINGNYALETDLSPAKDSLALEKAEGNPYANGIVTLPQNATDPRVKKLVELLRSAEVKKFIEQKYAGSVIPAA
ncbi:MetQ/NlpA family ABC transporter substrate-binding protein [Actinomadura sp. HBU206391]|uniref:MetQ/NlpA family ABC transporter substrate-binding protein n=1 Tax=Actinomadura sp. HBU206391 TaxID=2731692 RepID=UPI00165014A6|nr:MetQ/NlpA family ABC transporter substrate-binding protein [Actinomadura sp. HBU206391]MBC6459037.1 MetQ/NlpA family ABC transporter substrate-binding protein [Actinomadura sp. HBU206391]